MKVFLILMIFTAASPAPYRAVVEVPSIQECLAMASDFLAQDPATLDAKAIAAACERQAVGAPS